MTRLMFRALCRVVRISPSGWYRAADHGERVPLAYLYRRALVRRRARRGTEGEASAAYEYQASESVCVEVREAAARGDLPCTSK